MPGRFIKDLRYSRYHQKENHNQTKDLKFISSTNLSKFNLFRAQFPILRKVSSISVKNDSKCITRKLQIQEIFHEKELQDESFVFNKLRITFMTQNAKLSWRLEPHHADLKYLKYLK